MKFLSLLFMCIAVVGCSSSSSDSANNPLIGTWISNCHEYQGVESLTGGPLYAISEITFADSFYTDNVVSYEDTDCKTAADDGESFANTYTLGGPITASDGAEATRITITPIIPNRPDIVNKYEAVFRVTGVELVLGQLIVNDSVEEVPVLDYSVVYTKR